MKTARASLTVLIAIVTAMAFTLSYDAADAATLRAVLVGIDDYRHPDITDLKGCGNDVELIKRVLVSRFNTPDENVRVLKNAQATHQAVIDAIQIHLVQKVRQGDVAILHYSGHGSRMPDVSGDEIDGWDETLVAHDSRTEGVFDISDDEINGLLRQLSEKTPHVTFIFDSCHSGSAARAGNRVRMIPADNRTPPPPPPFALGTRGAGDGASDLRPGGSKHVVISGCLATELSNEALFEGMRHGALTWFLSKALLSAPGKATYRSVMDITAMGVTALYGTQHPQVEGPGIDLQVFGTEGIPSRPCVRVEAVEGQKVTVAGGRVYGLGMGSRLQVYPPDRVDFDPSAAIARIRITDAGHFTADAQIETGGPVVPGSRAVIETLHLQDAPIPVWVEGDSGAPFDEIRQALSRAAGLILVESQADARLMVGLLPSGIAIRHGDLELAAAPIPLPDPNAVQKVLHHIEGIVQWLRVRDLANPLGNLSIGFDVRRSGDAAGAPAPQEVSAGERLILRVHNEDAVPLYVYLLDVSSDGSVSLLYPQARGAREELPPGRFVEQEIETFVPEGRDAVTDVFKAMVTVSPIDPSLFERSGPDPATRSDGRLPEGSLEHSLWTALWHPTRGSRPVAVKSWITAERTVTIQRPGVRLSGFSMHFESEKKAKDIPRTFGVSRSLCGAAGEPASGCFRPVQTSKDGSVWEMVPDPSARGETETVLSVGRAFDEAYRIQEALSGAVRVEPLLEVTPPGVINRHGIEKRDITSDDAHDPLAEADDQWHLKQIRADGAWDTVRQTLNVPEGEEAGGILIAHVDTGYRDHPETWKAFHGKRPVAPELGRDYLDGDPDPVDPLLDDRILDNPGHGTASGSVIVSPAGCQLEGSMGCVNGVGRGAQLVPLRVHRTVSQFNTANLSRAIRDVAQGNVSGNPGLVSIAMGGPPTLSMWKAVREAEAAGVLIVAAAGNYVRTVVWPARFDATIAVAASNVRCRPWKDSSHGSAVDITAPGESVWRASFDQSRAYMNGMGKGTTFATGNTSGAAALWLSFHRNDPAFAELKSQGLVTRAFRNALRKSAWKPSQGGSSPPPLATHCEAGSWDADHFGPGILDVQALLEVPLDVAAAASSIPGEELPDLPLFSSLYGDGVDPERIRSDYRSLFGGGRAASDLQPEVFETEILHHYTLNPLVQEAVDGLVAGQRGPEPAARIREALMKEDLSTRLRTALRGSDRGGEP